MIPQQCRLHESTWEKIKMLFPPEQHDEVATILETECGNNLPFLERETPDGLGGSTAPKLAVCQRAAELRDGLQLLIGLDSQGVSQNADRVQGWALLAALQQPYASPVRFQP